MKMLCICWSIAAAIVVLWPRVSSLQRCTAQPPMPMELLVRPSFCAPSGKCRIAEGDYASASHR